MWEKKFYNSIKDALAYYNKSIDLRILVYVVLNLQKVPDTFLEEILVKDNAFFKCPLHDENTPSFAVTKKYFRCFGCKVKGDYVVFIRNILEKRHCKKTTGFKPVLDYLDSVIILDDRFLLRSIDILPTRSLDYSLTECVRMFIEYSRCYTSYIRNFYHRFDKNDSIYQFLKERRFSPPSLDKFGVGYCPRMHNIADEVECSDQFLELSCKLNLRNSHGRDSMFERLIFPIRDISEKILGFVGRDCRQTDNNSKFICPAYKCTKPPSFNGSLIYSALLFLKESRVILRSKRLDYICVTEGPLDCLRLLIHGHPAVSILGSTVTKGRIMELSKLPVKRFICCFDNDGAGMDALASFISYAPILSRSIQRLEIDGQCKDVDEHLKLFPNRFVVSDVLK